VEEREFKLVSLVLCGSKYFVEYVIELSVLFGVSDRWRGQPS